MVMDANRPKKPGNDDRGLECPKCGCKHFRVIYTRPCRGGGVSTSSRMPVLLPTDEGKT